MKGFRRFCSALTVVLLVSQCSFAGVSDIANQWKGNPAKYVFMFIGDGLGLQQINATEVYLGATKNAGAPAIEKLSFSKFGRQGMITTYSSNSFITDSAPAATSLATGYKTDNGVIGVDPTKTKKFATVAEIAKEKGMKVGIVSSVSINHATPAAFYAHSPSRNDYYTIGMQLIESGFDYFAGGGFMYPTGKDKNQPDLYDVARQKGMAVARDRKDILALTPNSGRVYAINPVLDDQSAMPYDIDRTENELSLSEFVAKGIQLLDNSKGFFMQVEGGKIDWACHANDAVTSIKDVIAFEDAVNVALEFAGKHPDETLIVVVGDHETGGMSIGFAGTQYESFFNKIDEQKKSYLVFDEKIAAFRKSGSKSFEEFFPEITQSFGLLSLNDQDKVQLQKAAKEGDKTASHILSMNLSTLELAAVKDAFERSMSGEKLDTKDEQLFLLYGGYDPLSITLTHTLNNKAGIGWTSYAHTGIPVPVFAEGVGAELFGGYYDNTDVAWKIFSIMGLPVVEPVTFKK